MNWLVSVELHTLPGEPDEGPQVGERVVAPGEAVLEAARARGLRTAVVAHRQSFYGERYTELVDRWIQADTSDAAAVLEATQVLGSDVVAVTSSVDNFIRVAARVADKLGLRGPDPYAVGIQRDKSGVRSALAAANVPDVRWGVADARDRDLGSPIGYPAVAKPVDGAAGWDVAIVDDDTQVRALAARHLQRSYGRGVRPRRRLLFEEVLAGPVYSAEGIVTEHGVAIAGYCDREMAPPPHFVELALTFAQQPPQPDVPTFVRDVLAATGHSWGPFHLEFVLTERGPRLIENNARFVGAGLQSAMTQLTGVAPGQQLVAALLGQEPVWPAFEGAVCEARLVARSTGTLTMIDGLADTLAVPGVFASGMYVSSGTRVQATLDSNSSRIGFTQAIGADRAAAFAAADEGRRRIALDVR